MISIFSLNLYLQNNNTEDPSEVVIDEFIGIFLIIIFIENLAIFNIYFLLFVAFCLFRLFDILKPYPVNWVDKNMKNAYGIILDDIIASIYTIIVLFLIYAFIQ